MDEFEQATAYIPAEIKQVLTKLPDSLKSRVQEIRLRADAPVILSTPQGEWMVSQDGRQINYDTGNALICKKPEIEECFLMLCEYSVHTHQNELGSGFITARNGCRAGIAGAAVVENGRVISYRNITSIVLRVARRHDGCASELLSALAKDSYIKSTIICGEPSSGKSSLLRDLALQLSTGRSGRKWRTAVVHASGELSMNKTLGYCDVICNSPKAIGIQQAVRCLAPDVVIFDELGSAEETNAVLEGLNSGVSAITSAHCRDAESLMRRPPLAAALKSGAFELVIFLEGRSSPGKISRVMKARDILAENCWDGTNFSCRCFCGCGSIGITQPEGYLI